MKRIHAVTAGLFTALLAGGAVAAELSLYTAPNFRGSEMTLHGDTYNLDRTGFNDRSGSVIVRSGRWEVCTDANFGGYCAVLGPGEYSLLRDPLYNRISSARPIAQTAYDPGYYRYGSSDRYIERSYVQDERGRYGALEMYTLPGFRGQTMRFDSNAATLDKRITEDGVSSIVIREGTWELCTGLDFSGTCRIYEPGRYPRLGSFEGAPIGSVRRVG